MSTSSAPRRPIMAWPSSAARESCSATTTTPVALIWRSGDTQVLAETISDRSAATSTASSVALDRRLAQDQPRPALADDRDRAEPGHVGPGPGAAEDDAPDRGVREAPQPPARGGAQRAGDGGRAR